MAEADQPGRIVRVFHARHLGRSLPLGLLIIPTVLLVGMLAACGPVTTGHAAAPSSTTPPTGIIPAAPTSASPTATTPALPVAPQPDPASAAAALIHNWEIGDRAVALRVATSTAVNELFAKPYRGQTLVSRQCSLKFVPVACSYGPNGGGSGSLYDVEVTPVGKLWFVSSVRVED